MLKVKGDKVEIGQDSVESFATVDYIWDVENFNELNLNAPVLSPVFYGKKCAERWRLTIKLYEQAEDTEKRVVIGLILVESASSKAVKAVHQVNVLNAENKIAVEGSLDTNQYSVGRGCGSLVSTSPSILVDGTTFRIHCQVSTQTTKDLNGKGDDEEYSAKKQYKSFLTNGEYSDVLLKTENASFPASKMILAAHSPVFCAMFSSGMLESAENIVKIEDFSDQVVKAFLEFLYTGETRVLEENPRDLLKIGDKYQVVELKKKAEAVILESLTIQNAVEILIMAHLDSPTTLKPKVIAFVNRNSKEILQNTEFNEMVNKFPELLLDLYTQV